MPLGFVARQLTQQSIAHMCSSLLDPLPCKLCFVYQFLQLTLLALAGLPITNYTLHMDDLYYGCSLPPLD